jgi:hypothetical protein
MLPRDGEIHPDLEWVMPFHESQQSDARSSPFSFPGPGPASPSQAFTPRSPRRDLHTSKPSDTSSSENPFRAYPNSISSLPSGFTSSATSGSLPHVAGREGNPLLSHQSSTQSNPPTVSSVHSFTPLKLKNTLQRPAMTGTANHRRKEYIKDFPDEIWEVSLDEAENFVLPRQKFTEAQLSQIYKQVEKEQLWKRDKGWAMIDYSQQETKCFKEFGSMQHAIVKAAKDICGDVVSKGPRISFKSDGNQNFQNRDGRVSDMRPDGGIVLEDRQKDLRGDSNMIDVRSCLRRDEFKTNGDNEKLALQVRISIVSSFQLSNRASL